MWLVRSQSSVSTASLSIVEIDISDGSTEIEASRSFVVTFSQAMDQTTLSDQNFYLRIKKNSQKVPSKITFNQDNTIITLDPDANLLKGVEYELVITANLRSVDGGEIQSEQIISFFTEYPQWQGANLLETIDNASEGDQPAGDLDTNSSGSSIAVWFQNDGSSTEQNIYARVYTVSNGWGTLEIIDSQPGAAQNPKVAINDNGDAIAVWHQHDGTRDNIWANVYKTGSGWQGAQLLESSNESAENPDASINENGDGWAMWSQFDAGGAESSALVNHYVDGSGWQGATLVESSVGGVNMNVGVVNIRSTNNSAIAIWTQNIDDGSGDEDLWGNFYIEGSGWQGETLIESSAVNVRTANFYVHPFVLSNGGLVVWSQDNNIFSNKFTVGSGWGTAESIESQSEPVSRLIASPHGGGHVVLAEFSISGTTRIFSNFFSESSGWGSMQPFTSADTDHLFLGLGVNVFSEPVVYTAHNFSGSTFETSMQTFANSQWDNSISTGSLDLSYILGVNSSTSNQALSVYAVNDGTRNNIWTIQLR